MALNTAIKEFVLANCTKVWTWYGQEDGSGAEAYFTSMTTPDKLNDFSSLEGGSVGGAPTPTAAPAQASTPASSGASGALATEYLSTVKPLVDALKGTAEAVGSVTVTNATDCYVQSVQLQGALMSTMSSFR